jgi:uncharacterized protein
VNYWDTSALLKLFISEPGSSDARAVLARDREIATALLTYVEAFSAFTRRGQDGSLTRADLARVRRRFGAEWTAYLRVPLTDEVVRRCRAVVERHGIKTLDAVHLASLLELDERLGERIPLVVADGRLLRAATAEGLRVIRTG